MLHVENMPETFDDWGEEGLETGGFYLMSYYL